MGILWTIIIGFVAGPPNWQALAKSSHQLRGERMMVACCTVRWRSPSTLRSVSAPFDREQGSTAATFRPRWRGKRWNAFRCAVFSMRIRPGIRIDPTWRTES